MPRCLIIAGPNGAGKTTFALEYLPTIGVSQFSQCGYDRVRPVAFRA